MLSLDEIYKRLQCCYIGLLGKQTSNVEKLIFDNELDSKVTRAYELLKIKDYIQDQDYKKYVHDINIICDEALGCGCYDCTESIGWIGTDPICEEGEGTTTTTYTTTNTTSTTSSTSTTTKLTTSTTSSTSSTTNNNTTSSTSTTSNTPSQEVTIPPSWLLGLALSSDAGTHDNSFHPRTTQKTQLKIDIISGGPVNGLSWNGVPWSNGIWVSQGVTDTFTTPPYTEVMRFNPSTSGNGGLIPGTLYKLSIRRENDNSVIYTRNITIPLVSQGVTPINLFGTTSTTSSTTSTTKLTTSTSTTTNTNTTSSSTTTTNSGGTTLFGGYSTIVNGIEWTWVKSPKMTLLFNNDGSVTDNTLGLVHGNPTTFEGNNCYYMTGYSYLSNNGNYKTLQNIQIPDGIYTIRRFDCDPSKIPNFTHFKNQIHGYPQENGVNEYNATLSEIILTKRTLAGSDLPSWMKISRKMNWPQNSAFKSISKSIFAIETINQGDSPDFYHSKGVHTTNGLDNPNNPYTFRTYKWPYDLKPGMSLFSDNDLYNFMRNHINQWGLTPDSIITDEVEENAQGQDPNIAARVVLISKGAFELFQERYPGINKRDTNLFGGYGSDDFTGFINKDIITILNRAQLATWLRNRDTNYFTAGHVNYRNVNVGYYMYNSIRNIPFELIVTNERVKVTTMEVGKESDWAVFGTTLCQTLVMSNPGPPYNGAPMGVEESHTGEIIPFPNGEILRFPSATSMIQEHRTLSFWARLISRRGTIIWGPGAFGADSTKIDHYTALPDFAGWPIKWRPTGQSNWENYNPGVNGAPIRDNLNGMSDDLAATVTDASKLGHDEAEALTGVDYTLYYASYTSSKKTFVATPGDNGYHLNGFGALNLNMLAMKDAYDQGCGVSLIGVTLNYNFAVYWNPYSVDEYEDNVIVTHGGLSYNFGRVYGRKTVFAKFANNI